MMVQEQISAQMTLSREALLEHRAAWAAFLENEAQAWQLLVRRVGQAAWEGLAPVAWERLMLTRIDSVLTRVSNKVSAKLASIDGASASHVPLEGYEEMTAKDIVAAIPELSHGVCEVLVAFEEHHKARATVLRAARQHLSS